MVIPPAVEAEIGSAAVGLTVEPVRVPDVVAAKRPRIGSGEAEVIALGMENREALVVLDDRPARRIARHLGLRVIGTLGVLLLAKRRGTLAKIAPVVEALSGVGFRMDAKLRRRILRLAGELPPSAKP